jgi:hypothetical protein
MPGAQYYEVRYSDDGGTGWTTVDANVTATSLLWTIPESGTSNGLIEVIAYDADNTELSRDASDASFIILSAGSVIWPNGGEIVGSHSTVTLQWSAPVGADHYLVRYSPDGGTSWGTLASNVMDTSLQWEVPIQDTELGLIRVTAYDASNTWVGVDTSDAVFTIQPQGTVVNPNGGEAYQRKDIVTVQWAPVENATRYLVRLSLDNGATWGRLADHLTEPEFEWRIPGLDATECLVRVTAYDASNTWLTADGSDSTFTITSP